MTSEESPVMGRKGQPGGRRLVRAGLTLLLVLTGMAILALTAGPVSAPADTLTVPGGATAPVAVEARAFGTDGPATLTASGVSPLESLPSGGTPAPGAQTGAAITTGAEQATVTGSVMGTPPLVMVGGVTATLGAIPSQTPAGAALAATPRATLPTGLTQVAPTVANPTPVAPTQVVPTAPAPTAAAPTDLAPSVTPEDVSSPTAPAPPSAYEDLGDLEAFFIQHRSTIAGQPFEIVSLTVDPTDAARPYFVLSVAGTEIDNVFAARSPEEVRGYGRIILADVKRYVGGAPCTIVVDSTYPVTSTDTCTAAQPWCQAGAQDPATGTWPVNWIYLWAGYGDGIDTLDTWNAAR